MEFFVWCWIWDRRLLCGLNHARSNLFIYMWLIPLIISGIVLPYAVLTQIGDEVAEKCRDYDEIKTEADGLQVFVYVMEAIIFLAILASMGLILRTRNIFNRLITKQPIKIVSPKSKYPIYGKEKPTRQQARAAKVAGSIATYDYIWEIRELSVKSPIGYLGLITGITNYVCSMIFISHYMDYSKLVESYGFDSEECEVSSAFVILSYCCLF
jgi:hypothetical protein